MFGFLVLALLIAVLTIEGNQLNQEDANDLSKNDSELLVANAQNKE